MRRIGYESRDLYCIRRVRYFFDPTYPFGEFTCWHFSQMPETSTTYLVLYYSLLARPSTTAREKGHPRRQPRGTWWVDTSARILCGSHDACIAHPQADESCPHGGVACSSGARSGSVGKPKEVLHYCKSSPRGPRDQDLDLILIYSSLVYLLNVPCRTKITYLSQQTPAFDRWRWIHKLNIRIGSAACCS